MHILYITDYKYGQPSDVLFPYASPYVYKTKYFLKYFFAQISSGA